MKRSVFGLVKNRGDAELVIDRLKTAGFSSHDISVLFPDESVSDSFAEKEATKAPEGATTGGTTGFVVGGVLGWLAGIGSLAIPGLGPFIAAGPILAALSGAAVGAAVGGITGALIGMGIPEHEARHYEQRLKEGHALISIHAGDEEQVERARHILEGVEAHDIATSGEVEWPYHTHKQAQAAQGTTPPPPMPPTPDKPITPPDRGPIDRG